MAETKKKATAEVKEEAKAEKKPAAKKAPAKKAAAPKKEAAPEAAPKAEEKKPAKKAEVKAEPVKAKVTEAHAVARDVHQLAVFGVDVQADDAGNVAARNQRLVEAEARIDDAPLPLVKTITT